MKYINLYIVILLMLTACKARHDNIYKSYDEYPAFSGEWKEMVYSPSATTFTLWAPTAIQVKVLLYEKGSGGSAARMEDMTYLNDGLWRVRIKGDLNGKFYAFNVKIDEMWRGDSPGLMPEAVGVNGNRAAILDMEAVNPEGWNADSRPDMKSVAQMVLYEMDLRSFTQDTVGQFKANAQYLSMTDDSTRTSNGDRTGISHLKELGITHVNLLPLYDLKAVDETKSLLNKYIKNFEPKNFNVPEGIYSSNPFLPAARINEFKQMIMAFHRHGIRVIMDVSYTNLAFAGSHFERVVPGYFYRSDEKNSKKAVLQLTQAKELATERVMARRLIVESVCKWINDYHIDGVRLLDVNLYDPATVSAVCEAVQRIDPTLLVCGKENFNLQTTHHTSQLFTSTDVRKIPKMAVLDTIFVHALCGQWNTRSRGTFIAGKRGFSAGVEHGISGGAYWEEKQIASATDSLTKDSLIHVLGEYKVHPLQQIVTMDDDYGITLADRFKMAMPRLSDKELGSLMKMAATALFTSQSIPLLTAGDEFMNLSRKVKSKKGCSEYANIMNWRIKGANSEYFRYVQTLIAMRRQHPAFTIGDPELISRHLEFLDTPRSNVIAFHISGGPKGDKWKSIIVAINSDTRPAVIDIPAGEYLVVCHDGIIQLDGIAYLTGSKLKVEPRSATIIVQQS